MSVEYLSVVLRELGNAFTLCPLHTSEVFYWCALLASSKCWYKSNYKKQNTQATIQTIVNPAKVPLSHCAAERKKIHKHKYIVYYNIKRR